MRPSILLFFFEKELIIDFMSIFVMSDGST